MNLNCQQNGSDNWFILLIQGGNSFKTQSYNVFHIKNIWGLSQQLQNAQKHTYSF